MILLYTLISWVYICICGTYFWNSCIDGSRCNWEIQNYTESTFPFQWSISCLSLYKISAHLRSEHCLVWTMLRNCKAVKRICYISVQLRPFQNNKWTHPSPVEVAITVSMLQRAPYLLLRVGMECPVAAASHGGVCTGGMVCTSCSAACATQHLASYIHIQLQMYFSVMFGLLWMDVHCLVICI